MITKLFEILIEKPLMKYEKEINYVVNFLIQPICLFIMCIGYVIIFIIVVIKDGL
jgi:large-conductance mechanosensitive channel